MQQLPESPQHQQKTAEEIIPGSLKRSRSYAEELAQMAQETLEQLAKDRHSPLKTHLWGRNAVTLDVRGNRFVVGMGAL